MYFWKDGTIANTATQYRHIILGSLADDELLALYTRSLIMVEKNNGDVTLEDLRLVKEAILHRMKTVT
jgi:hypothetical protein